MTTVSPRLAPLSALTNSASFKTLISPASTASHNDKARARLTKTRRASRLPPRPIQERVAFDPIKYSIIHLIFGLGGHRNGSTSLIGTVLFFSTGVRSGNSVAKRSDG